MIVMKTIIIKIMTADGLEVEITETGPGDLGHLLIRATAKAAKHVEAWSQS